MKRVIALILLCSIMTVTAEEVNPEPYDKNEFHPVLQDVRRASIIFCGAYPLAYMYSTILGDTLLQSYMESDTVDEVEKENEEIELKLVSSLVLAGIVVLIDFIIEKFFR